MHALQLINLFQFNSHENILFALDARVRNMQAWVNADISRLGKEILIQRQVLANVRRLARLLDQCNRFDDADLQERLKDQILFLDKVMDVSGVQNDFTQVEKIMCRVECLINTSTSFDEIMSELALITYFADDHELCQEFLNLRNDQTVLNFYISRKLSSTLSQMSIDKTKSLLGEFSKIVFTMSCGYNECGLYVIKDLLYQLAEHFNEVHYNHMMIVLDHMMKKSKDAFDQIFSSPVNVHPELKKIVATDLKISVDSIILPAHFFRACFIMLLIHIRQVENEPNCYAVAALIFSIQNRPDCVLRFIVDCFESGECKFGNQTVLVPNITKYLLHWIPLDNRFCEFSQRMDSGERSKLLQLTIGLVESQFHTSKKGEKQKLIKFICAFLSEHFVSMGGIEHAEGVKTLLDKVGRDLDNKIMCFPRYGRPVDLLVEYGVTERHKILPMASIGMLVCNDSGDGITDYYYLNSFEMFAKFVANVLAGLDLQEIPPLEKCIRSFSKEHVQSLVDKLIDKLVGYIVHELDLGLTHEYVRRCGLVTLRHTGGSSVSCCEFLGLASKSANVVPCRSSLDGFLFKIFEYFDPIYTGESNAILLSGSSRHSWVVSKNPFLTSFCGAIELQKDMNCILANAPHRVAKRMQRNVPEGIKKKVFDLLKIDEKEWEEFRGKSTFGEIRSFIAPILAEIASKEEAGDIFCAINIAFNSVIIGLEELTKILELLDVTVSSQIIYEIHERLPKEYVQPDILADILRKILMEKGEVLSKQAIEVNICVECDDGTLSMPIYLGDLNYGSCYGFQCKNDLVAMMNALTGQMQLYSRDRNGSCDTKVLHLESGSPVRVVSIM